MLENLLRRKARVAGLAVGAAALLAFPLVGAADADTGVLTIGSTSLAPGGSTTLEVELQSTGTADLDFSLVVEPQAGATGSFTLSGTVATKTPDPDPTVSITCFPGVTPNEIDCLWQGSGKTAANQATVTVTATASADALGAFDVTANDNFLTPPTVLDSGVITVAAPSTTTTAAPTTSTTASGAAATTVTPAFTG